MEFKQGSTDIPLLVQIRQDGVVITPATWVAQYSATTAVYSLECETADKTDTLSITSDSDSDNGIVFTLPESMFETAQRTWTCILQGVFDGTITDFALYTFEVQVTKGTSPNTR